MAPPILGRKCPVPQAILTLVQAGEKAHQQIQQQTSTEGFLAFPCASGEGEPALLLYLPWLPAAPRIKVRVLRSVFETLHGLVPLAFLAKSSTTVPSAAAMAT